MYIGYLQFDPQERSAAENISYIIRKLHKTTNSLIVLPELCLGSYYNIHLLKKSVLRDQLVKLLELSLKNMLTIVGTTGIAGNSPGNMVFYIQAGKLNFGHKKQKLFGHEKKIFNVGKTPYTIFKYKDIKIGVCICLDVLDPSIIKKMTSQKIEILLITSTVSLDYLWTIAKARSLENQIITIFTNRSGQEKNDITYLGRSTIFYPDGKISPDISRVNKLKLVKVNENELEKMRTMRKYLGII